jgi:hypothetical protein
MTSRSHSIAASSSYCATKYQRISTAFAHIVFKDLGEIDSLFSTRVGVQVSAMFRFPLELLLRTLLFPEEGVRESVRPLLAAFRIWNRHRSDTDRGGLCPVRFRVRLVNPSQGRHVGCGSAEDVVGKEAVKFTAAGASCGACTEGESLAARQLIRIEGEVREGGGRGWRDGGGVGVSVRTIMIDHDNLQYSNKAMGVPVGPLTWDRHSSLDVQRFH